MLGNLNGSAPSEIAAKLAALAHGEKVVLSSERKEIKVDPKLFVGYVGRYQWAPNFIISVTQEGDHQ